MKGEREIKEETEVLKHAGRKDKFTAVKVNKKFVERARYLKSL